MINQAPIVRYTASVSENFFPNFWRKTFSAESELRSDPSLSWSNYNYVSVLFTTPLGNKMLMITAALQLLGAWMIQKIVAIKV